MKPSSDQASCRKVNKQATGNRVSNPSRGLHLQMPKRFRSLPNGTIEYRKAMLTTNSTPHEEMGFAWIPMNHRTKKSPLDRREHRRCYWRSRGLYFFLPQLAIWTTAAACATAATAASTLRWHERQIWNIADDFCRDLLDVLALFDCRQPNAHGKRLQRDQINLLQIVKRHSRVQPGQFFPTSERLLNMVCQLGGSIHTQEARETIDCLAEKYVSCCIWQIGRTTSDQHLHPQGHRFDLLLQRNAHEFEQARSAQRSQLLGGLGRSHVHRATRKDLQDGPLHAQLATLANLAEPEIAFGNLSYVQRFHPLVVLDQNLLDVRPSRIFWIFKVDRKTSLEIESYRQEAPSTMCTSNATWTCPWMGPDGFLVHLNQQVVLLDVSSGKNWEGSAHL